MDFIQVDVHCDPPFREILMAEMGELDFEVFLETETGFEACIQYQKFRQPALQTLFNVYRKQTRICYEFQRIPRTNWNREWEKHYNPVLIGDQIYVRASFHEPKPDYPYELVINPKMSFGTGHHETTHQLLALQLTLDHKGRRVLDVGSGTGILAIMAAKLGAASVAATDIDDWCIDNAQENFELNHILPEFIKKGAINTLQLTGRYEIILANINTHVLLDEIPTYTRLMTDKGYLLLSGFYEIDLKKILGQANMYGLQQIRHTIRKNWVALLLQKT